MNAHSFCFDISIHSLRMEGDWLIASLLVRANQFQSTPSAWRETSSFAGFERHLDISIHSLRMEGDVMDMEQLAIERLFQSTPSAWRETGGDCHVGR